MLFAGLSHLQIAVSDLERSLDFYTKVFGLEVQFRAGPSMVFLSTPGASDLFTLRQAQDGEAVGPGGGFAHFGFLLQDKDSLDEAVERVESAGGKLLQRGEHQPGQPFAYMTDPDGYIVEL
jgi:catechol 2,3-dioxygenase-like lactoylglutathione lyase family enzyme